MVNSVGSYLDTLQQTASSIPETTPEQTLGQNAFLKLMMEQLKHQDPMEPKDNGEFISDMAQFSQVQELQNLSTAFTDFKKDMMGSLVVQASGLVGKQVMAEGSKTDYSGEGNASLLIELDSIKTDVVVDVYDANGQMMDRMELGQLATGSQTIAWDGTNEYGQSQPAGTYTFKAYNRGSEDEVLTTYMSQTVNSVNLNGGSTMTLNLNNGQSVSVDEVERIGA